MQQYALDFTVVLADCVLLNFCNLACWCSQHDWVEDMSVQLCFVFTAISIIFLFFLLLLVSILLCHTNPLHVLFYCIKKYWANYIYKRCLAVEIHAMKFLMHSPCAKRRFGMLNFYKWCALALNTITLELYIVCNITAKCLRFINITTLH